MTQPSHYAPSFPQDFGVKSGLLALRNAVAAYFADRSIPAVIADVGLKYRSFSHNQNPATNAGRVVFIPGKFAGDVAPKPRPYGMLSRAARNVSQVNNPREIAEWDRAFTVSIWSAPLPGKNQDEGSNIALSEDLLEQVIRAVNEAGRASIVWGEVLINAPPVENAFGAELLVSAIQRGPIFSETLDVIRPTANVERG